MFEVSAKDLTFTSSHGRSGRKGSSSFMGLSRWVTGLKLGSLRSLSARYSTEPPCAVSSAVIVGDWSEKKRFFCSPSWRWNCAKAVERGASAGAAEPISATAPESTGAIACWIWRSCASRTGTHSVCAFVWVQRCENDSSAAIAPGRFSRALTSLRVHSIEAYCFWNSIQGFRFFSNSRRASWVRRASQMVTPRMKKRTRPARPYCWSLLTGAH